MSLEAAILAQAMQNGKLPQPFLSVASNNTLAANAWGTALSVSGKGYLTHAVALQNVGQSSAQPNLRITIDGIVVAWVWGAEYQPTGFVVASNLSTEPDGTANSNYVLVAPSGIYVVQSSYIPPLASAKVYPSASSQQGWLLLDTPISFESSLLVEVMSPYASTSTPITFDIGGVTF